MQKPCSNSSKQRAFRLLIFFAIISVQLLIKKSRNIRLSYSRQRDQFGIDGRSGKDLLCAFWSVNLVCKLSSSLSNKISVCTRMQLRMVFARCAGLHYSKSSQSGAFQNVKFQNFLRPWRTYDCQKLAKSSQSGEF